MACSSLSFSITPRFSALTSCQRQATVRAEYGQGGQQGGQQEREKGERERKDGGDASGSSCVCSST
jgi:hypothetical protein